MQVSDALLDIDDQDFSQCYLPIENSTWDFQQPRHTIECLDVEEFAHTIPESVSAAALQPNDFFHEPGYMDLPPPELPITVSQPSHPSDLEFAEILSLNGLEVTLEFEEMIALVHALNGTKRVRMEHDINEDLLIRAVFEGWPSVFQFEYCRTCPLWAILCRVDMVLYQNCSVALRLAHLRAIYRMFMVCLAMSSACNPF